MAFCFDDYRPDGFDAEFDNPELVLETTSYQTADFIVEDGKAQFEPLPESKREIFRSEEMEQAPEHMESTDDAICELYEQTIAQSAIIDDQDAAICALYEMMEA